MGLLMTISSPGIPLVKRSEEHTSELQSQSNLVCRLLLEKKTMRSEEHKSELQPQSNIVCRLLLAKQTSTIARHLARVMRTLRVKLGPAHVISDMVQVIAV